MSYVIDAWNVPFKGRTVDVLLSVVSSYLDKKTVTPVKYATIINSSGTGKSRMVDEAAKTIITVPICLRISGSSGFPPADSTLRDWFDFRTRMYPTHYTQHLQGLLVSIFAVLRKHLATLEQRHNDIPVLPALNDISELSRHERDKYASLVRQRQEMLAFAFRDSMTRDQSFKAPNPYRKAFYDEVVEMAEKLVKSWEQVKKSIFSSHEMQQVKRAAEELLQFVDPNGVLDSAEGPRRPLVVLYFDEYHFLTDVPRDTSWSVHSHLLKALQAISDLQIFSLFLSTRVPQTHSLDPSQLDLNPRLSPITEISFDDLAFPAIENCITLDRVVQLDWISHLGRPLFATFYDALARWRELDDLLPFAQQKLLLGQSASVVRGVNGPYSLACLSVRFDLEFNADEVSCAVACQLVERHMRLILAASHGFKSLLTFAGSEPILAEAAFDAMRFSNVNPVRHLVENAHFNCIDRGSGGDLIAAFIIMQARDVAVLSVPSKWGQRLGSGLKWVSVSDFMKALLPSSAFKTLRKSLPTFWCKGEESLFSETFKDYGMWFNHVIRVEDSEMIKAESLWKFITRGAMVICSKTNIGVDVVLPICVATANISRDTVTAILIQVRTVKRFQYKIDQTSFDLMDPIDLLFSDKQLPRPVIRLVFALGSDETGVVFPPRSASESAEPDSEHHDHPADRFTSFDIWFAGLFPDTFGPVIEEDLKSYRTLLKHSLRRHGAFDLEETTDRHLGDELKAMRGLQRRRVAPLAMDELGHGAIHD